MLDYHQVAERAANPEATANPGNVHLCLAVNDAASGLAHARRLRRAAGQPGGPVDIEAGPNKGAKSCYLRIHDGVTLELFQPRAKGGATP